MISKKTPYEKAAAKAKASTNNAYKENSLDHHEIAMNDHHAAAKLAPSKKLEKDHKNQEMIHGTINIEEAAEPKTTHKHKIGDTVYPKIGAHKGHPHEVIHVRGDKINIKPSGLHPTQVKYKQGAASASPDQLTTEKPEMVWKKTAKLKEEAENMKESDINQETKGAVMEEKKTFEELRESIADTLRKAKWEPLSKIAGKKEKDPRKNVHTDGNLTRVTHNAPNDADGDNDGSKPGEKVKKGRGRPTGSKSGARSKGRDGGHSGTDDYKLNLPTKSVYF